MNDELKAAMTELEGEVVRVGWDSGGIQFYSCLRCGKKAPSISEVEHKPHCSIRIIRTALENIPQPVVREEAEDYRESSKAASDPLAERLYADAMGSPHAAGQVKLSGLTSDEWIARTARNAIRMARIFREAENETR